VRSVHGAGRAFVAVGAAVTEVDGELAELTDVDVVPAEELDPPPQPYDAPARPMRGTLRQHGNGVSRGLLRVHLRRAQPRLEQQCCVRRLGIWTNTDYAFDAGCSGRRSSTELNRGAALLT
jgi:hypothetical protein